MPFKFEIRTNALVFGTFFLDDISLGCSGSSTTAAFVQSVKALAGGWNERQLFVNASSPEFKP